MNNKRPGLTSASKDLIVVFSAAVCVFVASYFLNIFSFLVRFFEKNPSALAWVDEIITFLLTLSIGFAVIAWRRLQELKKETAERIRLQEELLKSAETRAETERIVSRQLHCDIEELKKIEREVSSCAAKNEGKR